MAASSPAPIQLVGGVAPPPLAYQKLVDLGAGKSNLDVWKTFLFGLLAGVYISMGALLALTVGGACPGVAQAQNRQYNENWKTGRGKLFLGRRLLQVLERCILLAGGFHKCKLFQCEASYNFE